MKKNFLTKILSIGMGVSALFGGHYSKAINNAVENQMVQQKEENQIINEINNKKNKNTEYSNNIETGSNSGGGNNNFRKTVEKPVSEKSRAVALG